MQFSQGLIDTHGVRRVSVMGVPNIPGGKGVWGPWGPPLENVKNLGVNGEFL